MDIPEDAWMPSYKVKPSQAAPVSVGALEPQVIRMRWGLLPHWMREKGKAQINAKSETAAEKPMFRQAMRHTRCVVLCDGFYEPEGKRQPRPWHFFQRPGSELMGLAGIYTWSEQGNDGSAGFAILTTEPNPVVAPIHDRMPVILPQDSWRAWLNEAIPPEDVAPLCHPSLSPDLEGWKVSDDAKKPSAPDGPGCIEPTKGLFPN